ncbi:phosphoglycolate phosphatase [Roseivivax isoporae]|uniref:Phosphoglycolate phosphatase n=1 Tax=Roseivivax isoporae LMG 25204 TaxID=1449351 RepID=X7FBD4_9RHOB|nr:phosphoglycolate phosphatase [Roseivivax isoporae]ETX30003.1 phosphoglycolate phosphatase [Roseivivax isoporae LMG 25204]
MSARIVFDLDGTLIDSAPDIACVANGLLAEEGRAPLTLPETIGFIGEGAGVFVARMRAARDLPETAQDDLLARFVAAYETAHDLTRLYPGAGAALEALGAAGHRLGLCTNKPAIPARSVLAHFDLARHFGVVIGGDTLATRKPDPAPLRAALDALGGGPALYVGDSETDAATAAAADVPFLLFTRGYRKSAAADLPHAAAFDDWAALPGLVAGRLEAARLAPRATRA